MDVFIPTDPFSQALRIHVCTRTIQLSLAPQGRETEHLFVGCLLACLTSQQNAGVSQGQICSDNCTWCHTEREVADQIFCLTQLQYNDTEPTSHSADPIAPGVWQGSHWSAHCQCTGVTRTGKPWRKKRELNPGVCHCRGLNH